MSEGTEENEVLKLLLAELAKGASLTASVNLYAELSLESVAALQTSESLRGRLLGSKGQR